VRSPDWCFLDDLEPGDHVYDPITDSDLEVLDLTLERTPNGRCVWRLTTPSAVLHYEVMAQVQRVGAPDVARVAA
jgi:hypothetical protein